MSPGLPALNFLAALSGRSDVVLRIVNTLHGDIPQQQGDQGHGVRFSVDGNRLKGNIDVGPSQQLFGSGVLTPSTAAKLGSPGIVTYGPITEFSKTAWGTWQVRQKSIHFHIPNMARRDYAVVGLDPRVPSAHVLLPSHPERWIS
jgi:hypothetical protein